MGKLIVIDGLDGSGKATQTELAKRELEKLGYNVYSTSFPNYNSQSSAAVKMYLNGELGTDATKLNPFMCSTFYAVDRAIQFQKELYSIYDKPNTILLADRYISANIIHQGGKFKNTEDMIKFFLWDYDLEVNHIGIPHEDITIALDVPVAVGQKLMTSRYNGHEEKKDIHESNVTYLENCHKTLEVACENLPNFGHNWVKILCSEDNETIRGINDIHTDIMNEILHLL